MMIVLVMYVMVVFEFCGSLKLSFGFGNVVVGIFLFFFNIGVCIIEGICIFWNLRIMIWVGNLLVIWVLKCILFNKFCGL